MEKKARKPVVKSETYQLRLKASEKQLIQQAAAHSGMGTADFYTGVLEAVSYVVLKYETLSGSQREEFERQIGAQVASVVYAGLLHPEKREDESKSK